MEKKIIIAIDGFSSCGKSTIARQLAGRLGYEYIDSGAMYRAIALYFLRNGVAHSDAAVVADALAGIRIRFRSNAGGGQDILLNGENVSAEIREMAVANMVSAVAAIREVRLFAVAQQQEMGKEKGIVMDGRDIGTVVFPDAELKIFMTADPEVRVMRRYRELAVSNPGITEEEVRKNIEARDHTDMNREESPLRRAADAVLLDNTDLNQEEQLSLVLSWVQNRL